MAIPLSELAKLVGGTVEGDGTRPISGVASLEEAGPGDVTFLANPRYASKLAASRAGAVVIPEKGPKPPLDAIRVKDPNWAMVALAEAFAPKPPPLQGVHPTAAVAPTARLGAGVAVGANSVIGEGAVVGDGTVIHPLVYVGPGVKIGKNCLLWPGVAIREFCALGDRVIVNAGTVIGSDGFGFHTVQGVHRKIPQLGVVEIGDDVELGANCAIDRARFGRTVIARGAKLDNMVHLAHNVTIGEGVLIAAQVAVAGSTKVGKHAMIGGQVAIAGHLEVGERGILTGQAGLSKDLPPGQMYNGTPAMPFMKHMRAMASMNKVAELLQEVRELRKRLAALEQRNGKA